MESSAESVRRPALFNVKDACTELSMSRSELFEKIRTKNKDGSPRTPEIKSILTGPRTRRIPAAEIDAYLKRIESEQWERVGVREAS